MRVISIDPGYERLGIAVLEKNPREKEKLLYSDCFRTSAKLSLEKRLLLIGKEIEELIEKYSPDALALENLFFNNNQKTALAVGAARGVILYEAAKGNLPVYEFTPPQIKVAVTGDGRGDKKQVTRMIQLLLGTTKKIKHDDEWDAIAVGLTFFACYRAIKS